MDDLQTVDSGVLVQGRKRTTEYVVAYAKIVESKDDGISLEGVFFGGVGSTQQEADSIARNCVNTIRGGTVIPKVLPLHDNHQIIDALYDAVDNFERITNQMNEAHSTLVRTQERKRR